jgi:hypothetical protein
MLQRKLLFVVRIIINILFYFVGKIVDILNVKPVSTCSRRWDLQAGVLTYYICDTYLL